MGARTERFRFYRDAGTTDTTTGTHTEDWTSIVCSLWAYASPTSDTLFTALRARHGNAELGLEVPFGAVALGLGPANRATWIGTDRTFDVVGAVDPDGRRRSVHIGLLERGVSRAVTA